MTQELLRYSVSVIVIVLMAWMIGYGLSLRAKGVNPNAISERKTNGLQIFLVIGAALLDVYFVLRAPFPEIDAMVLAQKSPAPWAAIILLLLGGMIIVISQSGMGTSWRVGVPDQKNHVDDLVTTGIYRFSRNPVYLGVMVFLCGGVVAAPSPLTLFAVVISYIGLTMIISQEERYLEQQFSDTYRAYKKRTRRWI